jgi:hypothetical protein
MPAFPRLALLFSRIGLGTALLALGAVAPGCGANATNSTNVGGSDGGQDGGSPDGHASTGDGAAGDDAAPSPEGGGPLPEGGPAPTSSAAGLAAKLGKPARLLVGLGGTDGSAITSQGITPDLFERYLVNAGAGDWTTWNSPSGAYVDVVAAGADAVGAVPMFTLYQMATNGDGNISAINDATFMTRYWSNTVLLFQRLAAYGKPALVHFEPDFWGYAEQGSPGGDPTKLPAKVSITADCASLSNDVAGLARCLVKIARVHAPKAYVGFSPSTWGASALSDVVNYMKAVGAGDGDIVVMQTLDRDAGCFEAAKESDCMRAGTGWYWDETNASHPNFQDHLAVAQAFNTGLGRPLVWWQTPLGVVSATPGGTTNHYRDNRVHYFLTNPSQLVAVGGLGVVFGAGSSDCTTIATDNGQYKTLSSAYLAHPAALP